MRRLSALAITTLSGSVLLAQPTFTNASSILPHNASSGGCMAVVDMDDDGLDDIVQLDMSTHVTILYQNSDHSFTAFDYGTISGSAQWGWAIADVDNNGHKDIIGGGAYDGTHYIRITSRGVYTNTALDGPSIFTQGMSIGDMDNDGKVDVFACHDDGHPNIWFTNGSGVPVNNNAYIDWSTNPASDMSGNYGSTFTDFDNDGDLDFYISHCRQGVNDPTDPRRWDRLFVNDGTDHFSDQAATYGVQNQDQVWTTDFGDYDNDGDLDMVSTTHSNTIELFRNDGTGHFTQVTAGSGLEVSGFFLQGLFRDMDNDGFLDVLTASAQFYFKGHGDGTFTQMTNPFPAGKTMHSFAFGDLNGDGFEDVYASYGDGYVDGDASFPDRLWLNTPNGNHWLSVKLKGVVSNRDAVGAKVTITGPWGTQVREVHAGESYGIVNSFALHFGLGSNTTIPTLTIHWPSGQVDTYNDLNADQSITAVEGTCISPVVNIGLSGPAVVCTGGSPLTLDATLPGGYTYQWSTTETTPSINVSSGGNYMVTVDDGNGCTGDANVYVAQDPDQTPVVTADGPTTFCQLDQVVLTSSASDSYQWSNTSTGQSITVDQPGDYTVTIHGYCADFTSEPISVSVLPAPGAPTSSDVNISSPGTADLSATGSNIYWYDAAVGGNLVGTGNNWTTPVLNTNTDYWCADANLYGGDEFGGGPAARLTTAAPGQYQSNNTYYLIFDAYENMVIESVRVYANGAGNRTIAVVDQNSNTVATGIFNIPDGESVVNLNFTVPAGTGYGLRVMSNNPQLWRDGSGSNPSYPYSLGALGAITGTSVTGGGSLSYYYFFYDWVVQRPITTCEGPRTEVHVTVGPTGIQQADASQLNVFPVPASDRLNITFGSITGTVEVSLMDMTGRTVRQVRGTAQEGMTMDLRSLASGDYALQVRHANGVVVRKVSVE